MESKIARAAAIENMPTMEEQYFDFLSESINNYGDLQADNQKSSMNSEKFISQLDLNNYFHKGTPVKVDCGHKPLNASTNCDPRKFPCLYHIPSDPCEYNNIAAENLQLVIKLMVRLNQYTMSMVPKLNTPVDPAGNPKYHNGTWVPWIKL